MIDVAGQLAGIPLFAGLSKEQVAALARIGVRRACKKGEQLFAEGDEGTGFYVVLTGRVKISKVSPEGKEQILHMVGPGEPFGEVPVFTGQGFPADATAAAQSTVLFFPRVAFVGLIKRDPTLALNMLAQLSRRLRQFTGLVEDLSLKEVPGRLAKYLLYLADRDGQGAVELDISKGQLASLLGTIPETLSRILARLDREGLIRSKGKQIRILDRAGLQRIAQEGR
jgi:CRP-like cAMP-binding protein